MSDLLTWVVLGAAETQQCIDAGETLSGIKEVLLAVNENQPASVHRLLDVAPVPSQGNSTASGCRRGDPGDAAALARKADAAKLNKGQRGILLDLYAHAIRFSLTQQFSPEKTSTLVGIMCDLHGVSMARRLRACESYTYFKELLLQHSVHRPPFSSDIFDILDVQVIEEYVLNSYYRHYAMYVYAFTPREVADIRCVPRTVLNQCPPPHITALSKATTKDTFLEKVEEFFRANDEQLLNEEDEASAAQERGLAAAGLSDNGPQYTESLKAQLQSIREAVSRNTTDRLEEIEAKLAAVEAKVAEVHKAAAPKRPGQKK